MDNQIVLQLDPSAKNARNSEGSFVTLKDGRILLAYTHYFGDYGDHGHAHIAGRYSSDGGRTWTTEDQVIVPQEGDLNVMSVSLLRLADGRIALFNIRKDQTVCGIGCEPWVRFSSDEAKTFSKPLKITAAFGYYVLNNDRVIQTRSGRLIVPLALHRTRGCADPGPNSFPDTYMAGGAMILYYLSDDGGHHWYESMNALYPYTRTPNGLQEPGVVELNDGTIYGFMRSRPFGASADVSRQWQTRSLDGGKTWEPAEPSRFISPCSPLSIKRIPSTGHLLAVWNDRSSPESLPKPLDISWERTPLTTAISEDEGRTWKHIKHIETAPDHGFCYTAIHFTEDAVLLAYCAGGATTKLVLDRLRVRRIKISDLY